MAAESGEKRAARFRELAATHAAKADRYARVAEAVEKGNAGEHKIAGLLDVLDGAGWIVLNDRYKAATSRANIDHILIGPPGVCVIDAKNWSGGRLRLDDRGMAMGRYRRDDELLSAKHAAEVVAARAREVVPGVITAPVIAFVQDVGLSAPVYHQQVVCLHAEHLLHWLTSVPGHLSPQQVHQVGSSLDAAFPPRTGSSKPLTVATVEGYRHRRAVPEQAQEPTRRVSAFYGGDNILPAPPPYPYQGRRQGPTRGVSVLARARRLALRLLLLALLLFVALPLGLTALQHAATNAVTRVVPSPAPSQPVIVHKPTAPKVTRTPGR